MKIRIILILFILSISCQRNDKPTEHSVIDEPDKPISNDSVFKDTNINDSLISEKEEFELEGTWVWVESDNGSREQITTPKSLGYSKKWTFKSDNTAIYFESNLPIDTLRYTKSIIQIEPDEKWGELKFEGKNPWRFNIEEKDGNEILIFSEPWQWCQDCPYDIYKKNNKFK